MVLTLHDFNVLSAERIRRDVQIARLKMELQMQQLRYANE